MNIRQRTILYALEVRPRSARELGEIFYPVVPAASIRRAIGSLRAKGYDITWASTSAARCVYHLSFATAVEVASGALEADFDEFTADRDTGDENDATDQSLLEGEADFWGWDI